MTGPEHVDYTVVLVFPGFGAERENAETVVEAALEWLNTNKDEPGFRFAYNVDAHLETVSDADEVRERIAADDSVATVIMYELDEDERDGLLKLCASREIGACVTVDAPRSRRPRKGPWRIVFGKPSNEPPAHRLNAETLTAPVGEDDDTGRRIGEVIAVLALGVMGYHFHKYPPHYAR
jgi:hypothetical protein